jgi:hypothetical protein
MRVRNETTYQKRNVGTLPLPHVVLPWGWLLWCSPRPRSSLLGLEVARQRESEDAMRVFIPQSSDLGIINGAHPKVESVYAGVRVEFIGHAKSKACGVMIEMTAHQALSLAVDLIHKANKHGADLQKHSAASLKRLSKKYAKESK